MQSILLMIFSRRKLKFNLNVDSSALLNANPIEFYSKAYVSEDVVNNFRTLPGIKNKTKRII